MFISEGAPIKKSLRANPLLLDFGAHEEPLVGAKKQKLEHMLKSCQTFFSFVIFQLVFPPPLYRSNWLPSQSNRCRSSRGPLGHSPFSLSDLSGWSFHPSVSWGWTHQWGASQWVPLVFHRSIFFHNTSVSHSLTHRVCCIYALMSDVVGIFVSMSVL